MEKIKLSFLKVLILLGMLGVLGGCANTENTADTVNSGKVEATEDILANTEVTEGMESLDKDSYAMSLSNTEALLENTEEASTGELTIHFMDVGQGDATLIECDDKYMLIDAGNNDKGTLVQNYLVKQGVETLDYVIGTHPDADHVGGLDVAIYKFDCETIILPEAEKDTKTYEDVLLAIQSKGYEITAPVVGDTYTLGSAEFTIISPSENYDSNANDNSVGILLENGENKFLFVGDAEEEAEEDMVNSGINLMSDVYKVSHHGSKNATTDAFLEAVSPIYAVISVGEDNAYGHPTAEVLNKLRMSGIEVFRTDEQGTIVLTSDGKEITWNCSPSETWQAGEAKGSASDGEKTEEVQASTNGNDTNNESGSNANGSEGAGIVAGTGENTGASAGNATAAESAGGSSSVTAGGAGTDTGAASENIDAGGTVSEGAVTDTSTTITETPAENTIIIVHITKSGSKYHVAGCQYLHSSDIEISLDEAKASGYTPCSKCNPPQ